MILTKPYFEIETVDGLEMLRKIEKAGRTCYKSEDKITDGSAAKFVAGILKRGHESVIEHGSVSVRIICDRGVTHEIVRHRLASYSQESTRYCNYAGGVTFIIPPWLNIPEDFIDNDITQVDISDNVDSWFASDACPDYMWCMTMADAETTYKFLITHCIDKWSPQQARSVLPNSLKTEIVMTCNLREWRHFFKLRTAPSAHPQMREIAVPMLKMFKLLIPVIFDDIE